MKKRFKKLTALFLALSMTLWMSGGAYASEVSMDDVPVTALSEDTVAEDDATGDTADSAAENGVTAAMTTAVKLREEAAALKSLTPGEEYVENEAFFLADSQEEAEKVAKEYNAQLKKFAHGVAVLEFDRNVADALIETADALTATTLVEPNYISHLYSDTNVDEGVKTVDAAHPLNESDGYVVDNSHGDSIGVTAAVPNDPWADEKHSYYQWFHEMVNSLEAHEVTDGSGIKVAVVDSGIYSLSEFGENTKVLYTSTFKGLDGEDNLGHGTNCSGIIGSLKNNESYGYGVAPGVDLVSVQITYNGSIETSDEAEGVQMAMDEGVQVISMSFGGPGATEAMQELYNKAANKGITLVAAAGNETTDQRSYPAAYDNVIAVASAERDGTLSSFSNYGDWVDIVAPGGGKKGLLYEPPCSSRYPVEGWKEYATLNGMAGTSMACPVVSAVAALVYASNSDFVSDKTIKTPTEVKKILLETTDGKEYSYNGHSVKGLVQADAAVMKSEMNYSLVDQSNYYGGFLSGKICQGGNVKLVIGDKTGNVKAAKAAAKSAVWACSDTSIATVKKGKVKCSKTAPVGSQFYVTATIGDETLRCTYTVIYKTKLFGQCTAKHSHKGFKYKFQSNRKAGASVGRRYNIANPYQMSWKSVILFFDLNKKTGAYTGYKANTNFRYIIKMSKSQMKKCTVETDKGGNPVFVTFNSPGTYTFKYKLIDGSNKTFKYTLVVK